jgi:dUTPase
VVPTRATKGSVGFDLAIPRTWVPGPSLDIWHAATVTYTGRDPALYMQRFTPTTPGSLLTTRAEDVILSNKPLQGGRAVSAIATGPSIPRDTAIGLPIDSVVMHAGSRVVVDTGVSLDTKGCYAHIYDRSSMRKRGITLLGTGIIDPDYTGSIVCVLWNMGHEDVTLTPGQSITQLVLTALPPGHLDDTQVRPSVRQQGNTGGFGSTDTPTLDMGKGAPCTCHHHQGMGRLDCRAETHKGESPLEGKR